MVVVRCVNVYWYYPWVDKEITMWQDYLLMVGNFILGAALIPMILHKNKPTRLTSVPTSIILYLFCVSFMTLGLTLAAVSVGMNAVMWTILFIQKWRKS